VRRAIDRFGPPDGGAYDVPITTDEVPVLARECPVCSMLFAEHDKEGAILCLLTMTA